MWGMIDYDVPEYRSYGYIQSAKYYVEYDCRSQTNRRVKSVYYSGRMATGQVLSASDDGRWASVAPETVGYIYLKIACGR
jgi:hypothetical protein